MSAPMLVKDLGIEDYTEVWQRMRDLTDQRDENSPDEIWLVEHHPVYTLGQAGRTEHILSAGPIPVVSSDRGGQVTYHGPGQLVCYLLIDIRRRKLGIRDLVSGIEDSVIRYLADLGITSMARKEAPGVYVDGRKIAALGLRVRRGCSYHGLSFNVDMDLSPFQNINPCGYEGLEVIDAKSLGLNLDVKGVAASLVPILLEEFGYDAPPQMDDF